MMSRVCVVCRRSVQRGSAWHSHMRAHVRRGEAIEARGITGSTFLDPIQDAELIERKRYDGWVIIAA